ncbi:aquaporin-like protein [Haematococcus lacustris]
MYGLGRRCCAELLGTMLAIYLGNSVVANALLPGSKGQGMGFGWLAVGYSFAFMFAGLLFSHVSAYLNPAFTLAAVVCGELSLATCLALAAAELAGAFLGGVATWLHYLPHFKTVPGESQEAGRSWQKPTRVGYTCLKLLSRRGGSSMGISS